MKNSIIVGLLALALLAGLYITLRPAPEPSALDYERERIAVEQARALAPVWTIAQALVIVGVPLLLLGAGGVALWRFRRLARPDQAGRLPALLDAGYAATATAALQSYHATEQTRATIAPVPHSLTYSPSTHYAPAQRVTFDYDGPTGELAGEPLLSLAAGLVPSFSQLLDQGRIGRGGPLLLGVDQTTGDDVTGSWLDLYSTIVSGLPGSGKTTSQRFLACQTALQGARFVVVDPHAGASEQSLATTLAPLHAAFLCEPASDDTAILAAVRLVADIGGRRVTGKDSSTYPIILWVDETTSLLSRSTVAGPLATLLEKIAQEYRKKNVFACASGQIWSASRTGDDSALRDSFASVICHRMKRSQARLLVPTDEAQRVERLGTGQALLWRTSGETSVIGVPNTTAADVVRVAGLLTDSAPTMERVERPRPAPVAGDDLATLLATPTPDVATSKPERSQNVAETVAEVKPERSQSVAETARLHTASQSGIAVSPDAARAAGLFLGGASITEVVKELRGVTSREGARYQQALAEVQGLLREGLKAGAS